MASKLSMVVVLLFHVLLALKLEPSEARTWIKVGYWYSGSDFPMSGINSSLFTHLIYAFAAVNSSSYELSVSSSERSYYSTFTETVKKKNPSITTLLSIGGGDANYSVLSTLVSSYSHRNSFIQSSIKLARLNGFQGLDLCWVSANTSSDMSNLAILFQEWRVAVNSEAATNQLILTAAVHYSPDLEDSSFPIDSIKNNLDWVHVLGYDYYTPQRSKFTGAHAALYNPSSNANTDYGIKAWIRSGLSASKLVLGLPFYGYAWTLVNPSKDNSIGAPAIGPAITKGGALSYKYINGYIQKYGAGSDVVYNAAYVAKYCVIGSIWIGFDDAEIVRLKVSYAKEKGLLGYFVWQVSLDDNWSLSLAAAKEEESDHENRLRLLLIIFLPLSLTIMLIALGVCYLKRKLLKTNGTTSTSAPDNDAPHLQVFSFSNIQAATNNFSSENKLGEGGFGPVYKGKLNGGQENSSEKTLKIVHSRTSGV
ncbi:hypothetical protein M0R45_003013 [Rubus argutus]|uniref:GH18 domain-containing protein n=1 Tax=Rubus argutus TaxID=59490 RepID=A0AAW1YGQ5_RUBAR